MTTVRVLGLDADVEARESQVWELCTELLEECIEPDAEEDERWVYVDHGQCGRESGDGRPGELEIACGPTGRGEDMAGTAGLRARAHFPL